MPTLHDTPEGETHSFEEQAYQRGKEDTLLFIRKKCEEIKCPKCNGDGFTAEHDLPERHGKDGECVNCPIRVYCPDCNATGSTETSPLQSIISFIDEALDNTKK
jgi:hypothetical protein